MRGSPILRSKDQGEIFTVKDALMFFISGLVTLLFYIPYIYFAANGSASSAIISFTAATIVVIGIAWFIAKFID